MNEALKSRLGGLAVLPTLPTVAIRALELCQRENLDLEEIAKLVGNDPALAARVMKAANSPAFSWRDEVRTLTNAVTLLGVNAVRTLILSSSLLRDARDGQIAAVSSYWKRSVLAALSAREIAAEIGFGLREEAFLAALLQDIGMLALRQLGDPVYQDLLQTAAQDHDRVGAGERNIFGCDHTEVGAWLVGRWRLPDCFRIAISHSHHPPPDELEAELGEDLTTLLRTTALSGSVADIWIRPDASGAAQRAHIEARKIIGQPGFALENVVRRLVAAIPQAASLFQIDLGDAASIARVAEQAEEALAIANVAEGGAAAEAPAGEATGGGRRRLPDPQPEYDPETRLPTRAFAERYLQESLAEAARLDAPVGLILAEVDAWGELSTRLRPEQVTTLLQEVARRLGSRLRRSDIVARVVEGKFLFVLPETGRAGVVVVAERSRKLICTEDYDIGAGWSPRVTISLGCTASQGGAAGDWQTLLALGNGALDAARATGGNSVTVFDRPAAAPAGPG